MSNVASCILLVDRRIMEKIWPDALIVGNGFIIPVRRSLRLFSVIPISNGSAVNALLIVNTELYIFFLLISYFGGVNPCRIPSIYGESLVPCMEPIEYHRGLRGLGTRLERVMHEVIVYIIYLHGDRSSPKVMHEVSHALYMATEPCAMHE